MMGFLRDKVLRLLRMDLSRRWCKRWGKLDNTNLYAITKKIMKLQNRTPRIPSDLEINHTKMGAWWEKPWRLKEI